MNISKSVNAKFQMTLAGVMIAMGAILGLGETAIAAQLKVTVENPAPLGGVAWSPFWFGFHDGTFDTFNVGESATSAIELVAEEGITSPDVDNPVGTSLSDDLLSSGAGTVFGEIKSSPRPTDLFAAPDFFPGEVDSVIVEVDGSSPTSQYFSYASMLVPSNDGFFANDDPLAYRIFDADGNFMPTTITVLGTEILDAGTEVNTEDPDTTPGLNQHVFFFGETEGGVILPHPGFNPGGAVLTQFDSLYPEANFLAPGYEIAKITIEEVESVPESTTAIGTSLVGALFFGLSRRRRWQRHEVNS
ncbi:MAG: PEP-CTERM sorting domain-containing protein [Cyanothece sp. SIO1E1]|nr:PEP-CTERM sorting domain-containing protein [Cyanothece sp. SIO1E1]